MLAGMLHRAGYFMGETFHRPRDSNPRGFFEWSKINRINESILAPHGKNGWQGAWIGKLLKKNTVTSPGLNQRWLMLLPMEDEIGQAAPGIEKKMRSVLDIKPFAFKDPRFSYTLPAWKPLLEPDTIFLCVFRDPAVTVESILKECRSQDYLASLFVNRRIVMRVWMALYRNIIDRLEPRYGNFHFVHYDQILHGTGLRSVADVLHASLNADFADPLLNRTRGRRCVPKAARDIYDRLCRLARYNPG